jgi:hypothetical protein
MIVNGYSLIKLADNSEVNFWTTIPIRIDLDPLTVVMGATDGWSNDNYTLIASQKTIADPTPVIPSITKRQAVIWLSTINKTEQDVLTAIATISDAPTRIAAQAAWQYPDGGIMHRSHPMFNALGSLLGIADMDAAFRAASVL